MIRLDKFLSEMSGWTRSEVKKIVRTGSVTVDGNEVKKPETKIDEKLSIVSVDGRQIKYNKYEYYMLNKPKGFVSATTDSCGYNKFIGKKGPVSCREIRHRYRGTFTYNK